MKNEQENAKLIKIHAHDNVAVVLQVIEKGEEAFGIIAQETIGTGHKMALHDLSQGDSVIKYGHSIGQAATDIRAGEHVHTHNLKTNIASYDNYEYHPAAVNPPEKLSGTFLGYERSDGKVGIRNEIWIINTVGCMNSISERIVFKAKQAFGQMVDDIIAIRHPYGCSQLGDDHENTRKILAGLAKHPNAGGVLVLGLGCENNVANDFMGLLGDYDHNRYRLVVAQEHEDEEEAALQMIGELAAYASKAKRSPVGLDRLIVGMKCGGSDGFSGITANPLAGRISDIIVAYGGTAILTETPEMFGAETILMNRCQTPELFEKMVMMINGFKAYFERHGQAVYENPAPGNKDGGISTLEDKSLGCIQKGGGGWVTDVLNYGDQVRTSGLNLLDGPGNDLIAITALAAAGAHMILFTTGRGTPAGAVVPTIKIASHSKLAARKANWIDFDAGVLLSGQPMETAAYDLWRMMIEVAQGRAKTKSEIYGCRELAIFKDGVVL